MWKYGEVHMTVPGSAPVRTRKFTLSVPGSSLQIFVSRSKNCKSVRGSSPQTTHSSTIPKRTGKFTLDGSGREAVRGSSLLAKPSDASLRGVIQEQGLGCFIHPNPGNSCINAHPWPQQAKLSDCFPRVLASPSRILVLGELLCKSRPRDDRFGLG